MLGFGSNARTRSKPASTTLGLERAGKLHLGKTTMAKLPRKFNDIILSLQRCKHKSHRHERRMWSLTFGTYAQLNHQSSFPQQQHNSGKVHRCVQQWSKPKLSLNPFLQVVGRLPQIVGYQDRAELLDMVLVFLAQIIVWRDTWMGSQSHLNQIEQHIQAEATGKNILVFNLSTC